MKQNIIKLTVFVCLGIFLMVMLFVAAAQIPKDNAPTQTTEAATTEAAVPAPESTGSGTEMTEPSETVAPTEDWKSALEANPYTPGDFKRNGQWMTCQKTSGILGVDISKYQGEIDWEQVYDAGIRFAIIRVGGRGYGKTGNLFADEMAQKNYTGAKAAGLQIGAYFFSQAISAAEAKAEADFVLEQIREWDLDLPVVFDWEYIGETARTANTDAKTVTACADAFCQRILAAGKKPMLYVRPEAQMLYLEELAIYPRWVALYSDTMDYPYSFAMWQYTKTGTVSGIKGNVDINLWIP